MKKYLTIIKTAWQRGLTYRFTIVAYRIGEIAELIILILMWTAIYDTQPIIKGFTLNEMITYILIGSLINIIIRNFLSDYVSREIKDGKLSLFLVKPMNYFNYIFTMEIGRISLPLIMSLVSQLIVVAFFIDRIIFNFEILYLGVILVLIILAFVTELLISYLVGLIAFWTDDVDGLQITIHRIKKFFSGGYFPLSLLSTTLLNISLAFPFAYSFFVPTQIYLKKISLVDGLKGLLVQVAWIIILYFVIKIVWKRGLKKYESVEI